MPEHVGQIADFHDPAELAPALDSHLEVAQNRLSRDKELIHEDVPRAHADAAGLDQGAEPILVLGSNFEVVVDNSHLSVEHEPGITGVLLHQGDERVEEFDEFHPETLIRLVPLAVPVGVRHDGDVS